MNTFVASVVKRLWLLGFGTLVLAVLLGLFLVGWLNEKPALVLVSVNAAVLLLPHWLTGIRTILTRPRLMLKIDAFLKLFDSVKDEVASDRLEFSLLIEGKGPQAIPSDVRFRYVPKGAAAGFLGEGGGADQQHRHCENNESFHFDSSSRNANRTSMSFL